MLVTNATSRDVVGWPQRAVGGRIEDLEVPVFGRVDSTLENLHEAQ